MLDKLERESIIAAHKKANNVHTDGSAMSFDPINEEEGEDAESNNGKISRNVTA
jgi:hypothetical protein